MPRKMQRNANSYVSFAGIEQQGERTQRRRRARNVSCPDVSASSIAYILTAEDPHEDVAEGD